MDTVCPHCGSQLPMVADAFCPACRQPLGEAPITSSANIQANTITYSPPASSLAKVAGPLDRTASLEERIAQLEWRLQQSNLHSESFLARAFTVWGHFMVAYLIILLPIFLIAMCAGLMSR
jgi:hypothetical protein